MPHSLTLGRRQPAGRTAAFVASLGLLLASTLAPLAAARAQNADDAVAKYPTQPVRWIVPYAAGGGTDSLARALGDAMQRSVGQPLIIDNRPGASTNIGVTDMLQAKPDGYTFLQADNAALLFNEHMFRKLPYNPEKDFTYIGAMGRFPVVPVVAPSFPAKNVAEFLAQAREQKDKMSYASPGVGSPHHVAMELLKQKTGIGIVHVPYKGAAPALQDVMGGQVPAMMLDLASGLKMIQSEKVRPLAIASPKRAALLPNVPTFAELGYDEINAFAYQGLIGPAGMKPAMVERINSELNKAMKDAKVVQFFNDIGFEPTPGTPAEFHDTARKESARWGKVIKDSNITLD